MLEVNVWAKPPSISRTEQKESRLAASGRAGGVVVAGISWVFFMEREVRSKLLGVEGGDGAILD